MAGATGKRHTVLLFTVLAGLFLMHGLSAPAMHGMPMPMPPASAPSTAMAMPTAVPPTIMPTSMPDSAHPQADAPTTEDSPDPTSDHMQAAMTCVPLRPEGLSALFLALFLIGIAPWRPRLSFPARLIHPHWPHGPPRTGVQILHALSISRT